MYQKIYEKMQLLNIKGSKNTKYKSLLFKVSFYQQLF